MIYINFKYKRLINKLLMILIHFYMINLSMCNYACISFSLSDESLPLVFL